MTDAQPETNQAEEFQRLAVQDETQAAMEAAMAHLQNRVVALNVEVRARDARIAELEATLAAGQSEATDTPQ